MPKSEAEFFFGKLESIEAAVLAREILSARTDTTQKLLPSGHK